MFSRFDDEHPIPASQELPSRDPALRVALIYPHSYYLGMSYLGLQAVYGLIFERTQWLPQIFFCDERGRVYRHPSELRPGYRPPDLKQFTLLAFSLPYELGYIGLYQVLASQGIPVLAAEREGLPLIIAGGYAMTMNPQPLGDVLDLCYLGEAEGGVEPFFSALSDKRVALRTSSAHDAKHELLRSFSGKRGFYIPDSDAEKVVRRHYADDLNTFPAYSRIVAERTVFPRRLLMQIARGCASKCAFCLAGHTTGPLRFVSADTILTTARKAEGTTDRLGVISASPSDHPQVRELTRALTDEGYRVSFSSLRLSTLDDEMVAVLLQGGQQTVTIAPEVLDEDYRKRIAKPFPANEVILQRTQDLLRTGVPHLKYYYMLGFEFEDDDYIRRLGAFLGEIVAVAESVRPKRRMPSVTFSFGFFVPKPQTPLELAPMSPVAELKRRRKLLKKHVRGACTLKFESAERALLQEALSRGGRETVELLRFLGERSLRTETIQRAIDAFHLEEGAVHPRIRWPRVEA